MANAPDFRTLVLSKHERRIVSLILRDALKKAKAEPGFMTHAQYADAFNVQKKLKEVDDDGRAAGAPK